MYETSPTSVAAVSLPMYDLEEIRPASLALRSALAASLTRAGWPAIGVDADDLDHDRLEEHWKSSQVALSHSCGLPIVESLRGRVRVLGTFRWLGVTDDYGRYAPAIVVSSRSPVRRLSDLTGARPAINAFESLSGWASLGAAFVAAGLDRYDLASPIITGSHVASLAAVGDGRADVASVDPITLALIRRYRPSAVDGVRLLGLGPRIPATPLITRREPRLAVPCIRDAIRGALAEPGLRPHLRALGISGFTEFDDTAFASVAGLVGRAQLALSRPVRQLAPR